MLTNKLQHYAFSTNSETGEVALYVDEEQLGFDCLTMKITSGNRKDSSWSIDYDNVPYGNVWDATGSGDTEGYFDTNNATIIFEDNQDFCST
eukprot:12411878-Ditylum_brightwellii.AAC.1